MYTEAEIVLIEYLMLVLQLGNLSWKFLSDVGTLDGLHLIFHFVDEPLTKTCDKITTRTTRMGKLSQIFFPEVGTPEHHGKMINIHFPCIDVPLFLRQAFSDH